MCNLGEKGEFPTPPKLCPPKLLKIYLVVCRYMGNVGGSLVRSRFTKGGGGGIPWVVLRGRVGGVGGASVGVFCDGCMGNCNNNHSTFHRGKDHRNENDI